MTQIVESLFGVSPERYQEQKDAALQQEALAYAQLDPYQRATAGIYAGARGLASGIGRMLGGEDPALKLISLRNSVFREIDQSNPESFMAAAGKLNQSGDQEGAMAMANYARTVQAKLAGIDKDVAAAEASRVAKLPSSDIQVSARIGELTTELASINAASPRGVAIQAEIQRLEKAVKADKPVTPKISSRVVTAGANPQEVFLDENLDLYFTYGKDPVSGKQIRVPYYGAVAESRGGTKVDVKVGGDGPQENEFMKKRGITQAQALDEAQKGAVSAAKSLTALGTMREQNASGQLFTGPLANAYVGATSLLASIGLLSKAQTANLTSSEIYDKNAKDLVMIDLDGKLGSQVSDADRKYVEARIPQLTTSQQARTELINKIAEIQQGKIKFYKDMNAYANKYDNLNEFDFSKQYVPSAAPVTIQSQVAAEFARRAAAAATPAPAPAPQLQAPAPQPAVARPPAPAPAPAPAPQPAPQPAPAPAPAPQPAPAPALTDSQKQFKSFEPKLLPNGDVVVTENGQRVTIGKVKKEDFESQNFDAARKIIDKWILTQTTPRQAPAPAAAPPAPAPATDARPLVASRSKAGMQGYTGREDASLIAVQDIFWERDETGVVRYQPNPQFTAGLEEPGEVVLGKARTRKEALALVEKYKKNKAKGK